MRNRVSQRIRPLPRCEQRPHKWYRTVERRAALLASLHEQNKQAPAWTQPAAQVRLVCEPKLSWQRAEAGLVVDGVEQFIRHPRRHIGLDRPLDAEAVCLIGDG